MYPEVHTEHEYPPIGQTVTRFDHCSCFAERRSLLAIDHICWFCKFAAASPHQTTKWNGKLGADQ